MIRKRPRPDLLDYNTHVFRVLPDNLRSLHDMHDVIKHCDDTWGPMKVNEKAVNLILASNRIRGGPTDRDYEILNTWRANNRLEPIIFPETPYQEMDLLYDE